MHTLWRPPDPEALRLLRRYTYHGCNAKKKLQVCSTQHGVMTAKRNPQLFRGAPHAISRSACTAAPHDRLQLVTHPAPGKCTRFFRAWLTSILLMRHLPALPPGGQHDWVNMTELEGNMTNWRRVDLRMNMLPSEYEMCVVLRALRSA
jgi:hypothetical protein